MKKAIGVFFNRKKFALLCKKHKEKLFEPNKYEVIKIKGGWLVVNKKQL